MVVISIQCAKCKGRMKLEGTVDDVAWTGDTVVIRAYCPPCSKKE